MLRPRWHKILGDLWSYKLRTAVVILSIAVGVFAVGMIAGTQVILTRDMQASYLAIDPPAAILGLSRFDDDLVEAIRHMPQIDEAEGHAGLSVRVRTGPDMWRTLAIGAFPDYNHIRVNKITSEQGAWPPPKHEVLIERSSLSLTNATIGDSVTIELADGTRRSLRIAGTVHNINMPPAAFTGRVDGFVTFDTLEWLGQSRDYTSLFMTTRDKTLDRDGVGRVVNQVRDKIERGGYDVPFSYVPIPGKHPADASVQPMLLILGVLGAMSLLLSGFLVINTIGALLMQQVRQIGVMKAIGANTRQITGMYLATVLIYGLLSLLIAVPLGAAGAYGFTTYLARLINFDVLDYATPPSVLALEIGAGLVVPLLAALWPVLGGARVTVREAISSYGLGGGHFGRRRLDQLLERVRVLSRPMLLSLRNTFRRKGRLALTMLTLVLGGATFIGVFSVREGLFRTAEQKIFTFWRHDLIVTFDHPYATALLAQEALRVPGVVRVAPIAYTGMRRLRPRWQPERRYWPDRHYRRQRPDQRDDCGGARPGCRRRKRAGGQHRRAAQRNRHEGWRRCGAALWRARPALAHRGHLPGRPLQPARAGELRLPDEYHAAAGARKLAAGCHQPARQGQPRRGGARAGCALQSQRHPYEQLRNT